MIKFLFFIILSKFMPCIKNTVFFDSFHGQYNDNPKFISEKLHEMFPDVKIVWCVSEKGKDIPPKYAKLVKYGSMAYYVYAFNSEVAVDNNVGIRTLGFKDFQSMLLKWLVKKKNQLCISTWHGTPIKRVGKDQLRRNSSTYYTSTDFLVSGSEYNSEHLGSAFYIERNRIRMYGMPRTDILFQQNESEVIKGKLGIPTDKRVVLFAPTFRKSIDDSGINQLKELEVRELLTCLKNKFGKEFVFIYRVHHTVAAAIETEGLLTDGIHLINGNEHDDMAEYLSVTDVLITDYSGSMFDFAITQKPCFLFAHDLNRYLDERGLYIDFDTLPFPKAQTKLDLYEQIEKFDFQEYVKRIKQFNAQIGNCEDGNASYRVTQDIIMHLGLK